MRVETKFIEWDSNSNLSVAGSLGLALGIYFVMAGYITRRQSMNQLFQC